MDIESHLLFASKLAVDINNQRAAYEKEWRKSKWVSRTQLRKS